MPKDSDANGAYHIAMKGLQYLQQLQNCEKVESFKLDMNNKSWYGFIQKK